MWELRRTAALLALGCAAAIVVGSLGPWVELTAAVVGTVSINGLDEDGRLTLGLGGLAVVLAAALAAAPLRLQWLAIPLAVAFAASAGLGIYNWFRAGDRLGAVGELSGGLARAVAGWGLYTITFAGLAGLGLALLLRVPEPPSRGIAEILRSAQDAGPDASG